MNKKVVFLPYDMDTALGINNEGALEFSYNLEDTDVIGSNKNVYNGQDSVLWNNVRLAFFDEIKVMYQNLRSQNKLSYDIVESAFEAHQSKWPEALVNEDSQFTYLDPLVNPENGASPSDAYISMLQGLKTEQRKWWLYNRLRYCDSKYNAGDALTDVITVRGYSNSDIVVTPYADIYASVKYGSYLVQQRATRNVAITLPCPLDTVNDTEIYIYSASQLASIGDISNLMIGYADFSNAIRLQSLKIGDSSSFYENPNILDLYLGNNVLLQVLDARRCVNLGGERTIGGERVLSKTPSIDMSGCLGIEEAYFDNTSIKGVVFPVGGSLRVVHLPATVTNLTLRNQPKITDLTIASYANITTLRIENCSSAVDPIYILNQIQANSRVRLVGFTINVNSKSEIDTFYAKLDTMRGLDEYDNTLDNAAAIGTIHIAEIDGAAAAAYKARYPYITIDADTMTCVLTYKTYDGSETIATETVLNKGNGTRTNNTSRTSDAQYSYTPNGWSLDIDGSPDANALVYVDTDRTVYAAYSRTVRTYTITWKNSDNTTLETDNNVPYGSTPQYNGSTPTYNGETAMGWEPAITTVTGNATYTASYKPRYQVRFYNGSTLLQTSQVVEGQNAVYTGETPVSSEEASLEFLGWNTDRNAGSADSNALRNITAAKDVYAIFEPLMVDAEITDSWETILNSINNGTYRSRYKYGNYKPLDFGSEGVINMQIVAMDSDVDVNGNTIPLTFVAKELLTTSHRMNPTNTTEGGWEASEMRSYLNDTILPLIRADVRSQIVAASKISRTYAGDEQTSIDRLWIPSAREITGNNYLETNGPIYRVFKNDASRLKEHRGFADHWWVRSANSDQCFYNVSAFGGWVTGTNGAVNSYGIALGFCLGDYDRALASRAVSYSDLVTAMDNGTYATAFKVGDVFPLDLGIKGNVYGEIVAFDADDKADGSGKAKVTVITKQLSGSYAFNIGDTDDWATSSLRTYLITDIAPLIPSNVSSRIVAVNKTYGYRPNDERTSIDSIWIPSVREVFDNFDGAMMEMNGPSYTDLFKSDGYRVKKYPSNYFYSYWWLRTVYQSSGKFAAVNSFGVRSFGKVGDNNSFGIALGFCLD